MMETGSASDGASNGATETATDETPVFKSRPYK